MKLTPAGEAWTEGNCPLCDTPHRLLTDEQAVIFAGLGMSDAEITAIRRESEAMTGCLADAPAPIPTQKPSDAPSRVSERVRRWRERQRQRKDAG